ncbi:DEAD/DEAH box helicase [Mycoplasmatota bacterium WC44]
MVLQKELLLDGVKTSLIDCNIQSNESYRPKLILNDRDDGVKVLSSVIDELESCDEFIFSVAFITNSGISSLINTLLSLKNRGIKGKILTTNYLTFTDPKALRRLLNFENIEVRLFSSGSFHTKGYIFKKASMYTMIVGSSNLTAGALSVNREWNIKIDSLESGELINKTIIEFGKAWDMSELLTMRWIESYEIIYNQKNTASKQKVIERPKEVKENSMQSKALLSLKSLRESNEKRGLVVSATGTGKTYLSALDVKASESKTMLFIVHRENIARKAMSSYKKIFGNSADMGFLIGNQRDLNSKFIFCTVQSMSKYENLELFEKDYFDYIVVDEVHRAGAKSYEKILNYFKPKFILGMTATPERNDDYNIFQLFDYNIAYEIRLHDAMEEELLCPFHYYGVTDLSINGITVDELSDFNQLTSDERVEYILETTDVYQFDGDRVKGLVFCSRNEVAKTLSDKFNAIGYNTIALSGKSSETEREEAIIRLEQTDYENKLDYIFTVDIFNEGIDIPSVNQIIMLRPTQSSIIFVQQLGRGLRKHFEKEHVIIIDFIGNYKNNYMIPIALYGDKTLNKDNMRKLISSGSDLLPGVSTINFDKISKQRIYDAINKKKFSTLTELRSKYQELKMKINRIPTLMDFVSFGSVDPRLFSENSNKSYYNFLKKVENDLENEIDEKKELFLQFITSEVTYAKRPHELVVIQELINNDCISTNDILNRHNLGKESLESALNILARKFNSVIFNNKYKEVEFFSREADVLYTSETFKTFLSDKDFRYYLDDLLVYSQIFLGDFREGLTIYDKYSRKDVCRLLNWDKNEEGTINGYKIKHNTCPIFVNYHKEEHISSTTKYSEKFNGVNKFSWMTRSRRKINSPEVTKIINHEKLGIELHMFIKKDNSEGKDFYYLGRVVYKSAKETTLWDDITQTYKPIVNIQFDFEHEVRKDIYKYLTEE